MSKDETPPQDWRAVHQAIQADLQAIVRMHREEVEWRLARDKREAEWEAAWKKRDAAQQKKWGAQIADINATLDRVGQRLDEVGQRLDEAGKKIDAAGEKLDKIAREHGGHLNNVGSVTEVGFFSALKRVVMKDTSSLFDGINFEKVFYRYPVGPKSTRGEVDILLLNGEVCLAVEVKYRFRLEDIERCRKKRKQWMEYLQNEFEGSRCLFGVASYEFAEDTRDEVLRQGWIVVERAGGDLQIDCSGLQGVPDGGVPSAQPVPSDDGHSGFAGDTDTAGRVMRHSPPAAEGGGAVPGRR